MTNAQRESVMSRIQKLMERALHEATPPAEAEACMAKADALMAQHMIDRSELTAEQKSRVTQDIWEVNLSGAGPEFYSQVYSLMRTVLKHCGIRETRTADYKGFHVVGFPEDIAYAERMWFRIFKEFVVNVNPTWDDNLSEGENIDNFLMAGFTWRAIWIMRYKAGAHPINPHAYKAQEGGRLRRAHKKFRDSQGVTEKYYHTRTPGAYRSSYAQSFRATLGQRLEKMRTSTEEVVGRDKFLLARVSTDAEVEAEFYRLFPEYDPEVQRRKREAERAAAKAEWDALSPEARAARERAEEAERKRNERYARTAYRSYRSTAKTYDSAGWNRGRRVAENVNLRDDKAAGHKRKEVGQ